MSTTLKALSIVRREEEDNHAQACGDEANDHQANAELPGNNDAVDRREAGSENAHNLEAVGATHGYEQRDNTGAN
jgi:hypothetical protein